MGRRPFGPPLGRRLYVDCAQKNWKLKIIKGPKTQESIILHKSAAGNFDFFFCLRSLIQNHYNIINPTGLFAGCIRSIFNSPFYQSKAIDQCIFPHDAILITVLINLSASNFGSIRFGPNLKLTIT